MNNNKNAYGVLFLILLLAGKQNSIKGNNSSKLLSMPDPGSLMKDFHRMVNIMGKVDNLGQMAINPPKLPEPAELVNTAALPDLSGIMETLGPLMNNLTGQKGK